MRVAEAFCWRLKLQILHLLRLFTSTSLRLSLHLCITCCCPHRAVMRHMLASGPCSANKNVCANDTAICAGLPAVAAAVEEKLWFSAAWVRSGGRLAHSQVGICTWRLTELSTQSLHVMEVPVQGLSLEQLRRRRVAPEIKKTVVSVDKRRS